MQAVCSALLSNSLSLFYSQTYSSIPLVSVYRRVTLTKILNIINIKKPRTMLLTPGPIQHLQ